MKIAYAYLLFITGLLRRDDADQISKELPIGILPVGFKNQMARNLFPDAKKDVELMAQSAMSVIKQLLRPVDVIKVKSEGKSLYGMRELQAGAFTDAHHKKHKYWYWAGLKKYMTYIFSYTTSASTIMWSVLSDIDIGNL